MAKGKKTAAKTRQPNLRLTAAVTREGKLYVAQCLEVDVASQGHSLEESLANLREALELYLEDAPGELPRGAPIIAPVEVSSSSPVSPVKMCSVRWSTLASPR